MTAFDASPALVALAEAYAGQPVFRARFQDIDWRESFDGVWACASLLHLPAADLPGALGRLAAALVPGGVMYASFKYGHGEREDQGRHFIDLDEAGLSELLDRVANLHPLDVWSTADLRPGRENERWLNALLRQSESAPG